MAVSDHFLFSLTRLRHELRQVEANDEYAIFGSASLLIRGIISRDPGDIDVLVSPRVWGQLLPRPGWIWETPNTGDPPILSWPSTNIPLHLFFDWRDPWLEINVTESIEAGESVYSWLDGEYWRCVPKDEVRRHKVDVIRYPDNAKRKMHEEDIAAIDRHIH